MRILAIDTTQPQATILLIENEKIKARKDLPSFQQEASELFPLIEKMMYAISWTWTHIDRVGVVRGPGGFTSVRIGVMVAASVAFALNRELVSCTRDQVVEAGGDVGLVLWELFQPQESVTPLYDRSPNISQNKKIAKLNALKKQQ